MSEHWRNGIMDFKSEIAKDLLNIKAVQIKTKEEEYFTWTSGIQFTYLL